MTSLQLYWLTRLDQVNIFLTILVVSCLTVVVMVTACGMAFDEEFLPLVRRLLVTALILGIVVTLVPSTKEMAAIIVAPKLYNAVVQNKELQEMPSKVVDLANAWLEELKPGKK